MITAYRPRDVHPPTGHGRNAHRREIDRVSWEFERVRSLMIEGAAEEFGLEPVRRRGGPTGAETEDLEISVEIDLEIDLENDADPAVSDHEERFAAFLYALEDRDVGHLLFEVDRTEERAFLDGLSLAFLSVYDRGSADPPRNQRPPRAA